MTTETVHQKLNIPMTTKLSGEQATLLKWAANHHQMSVSAVQRVAIQEYLNRLTENYQVA